MFTIDNKARTPKEILYRLKADGFIDYLKGHIYGNRPESDYKAHQQRFIQTMELHRRQYGDRPCFLIRAPGRLNLFTEYLDMCDGDHMSTTIDGDLPLAISPAENGSDVVRVCNANPLFEPGHFSISDEVRRFQNAPWDVKEVKGLEDNWKWRTRIYPYHGRRRGDYFNYILAPYLRAYYEWPDSKLKGCDMTFGPSLIPIRAGTSSSSAVVVLSLLSLLISNRDSLPPIGPREICGFLGEAEWYVGTRGGANDQTTIFRNEMNGILYNQHHKDPIDSKPLPWIEGLGVIVCNSLWEADKALGSRYVFNMRKGWMDLARDLLVKFIELAAEKNSNHISQMVESLIPGFHPPDPKHLDGQWKVLSKRFCHLGSLDTTLLGMENQAIEELINLLPEFITPEAAATALGKSLVDVERDYTLPNRTDKGYKPRNAALFFYRENRIGRSIEATLIKAESLKDDGLNSATYKKLQDTIAQHLNQLQDLLKNQFQVSNSQIELLLSIARKGPGFKAGKLTGAGSGGCVCLLVEEESTEEMLNWLDQNYFGKPENFRKYQDVLKKLASASDGEDQRKAAELGKNLNHALASPSNHRRVVTFSKGAGVLF